MSKIITIIASTVLTILGVYLGFTSHETPDYSYLQMENIEALSQNEGQVVDKIKCWSDAEVNGAYAYVNCASCERIVGYMHKGPEGWCSKIRH